MLLEDNQEKKNKRIMERFWYPVELQYYWEMNYNIVAILKIGHINIQEYNTEE